MREQKAKYARKIARSYKEEVALRWFWSVGLTLAQFGRALRVNSVVALRTANAIHGRDWTMPSAPGVNRWFSVGSIGRWAGRVIMPKPKTYPPIQPRGFDFGKRWSRFARGLRSLFASKAALEAQALAEDTSLRSGTGKA